MDPSVVVGIASAATGATLIAVGARAAARTRRGHSPAAYLEEVIDADAVPVGPDDFAQRLARPFLERTIRPLAARTAASLGSVTPRDHRARLRAQLGRAGLDDRIRPDEVIAAQAAGLLVGFLAGLAVLAMARSTPIAGLAGLLLLCGIGAAAPLAWLQRRVDRRIDAIRRDLPETLDLLAISVEAGLGLEGAMEVVVGQSSGPLAGELVRTLQEMELGCSRRDALVNLKDRTHVTELSTFVQSLVQADVLGMPLAHVLQVQAGQMRVKRRQWARERAGKLPVKILFPLVGCIFPAILVVVLGPAVTQIGRAF